MEPIKPPFNVFVPHEPNPDEIEMPLPDIDVLVRDIHYANEHAIEAPKDIDG